VHVWEPSLLVLNYINVACVPSEKAILQVCKELLNLKSKDASNKIWPVVKLLLRKEVIRNFRLLRVSYKGNKEGRFLKVTDDSYKILKELLHKPVPAYKGRREDKPIAEIC
jgi:hypothetical protein